MLEYGHPWKKNILERMAENGGNAVNFVDDQVTRVILGRSMEEFVTTPPPLGV